MLKQEIRKRFKKCKIYKGRYTIVQKQKDLLLYRLRIHFLEREKKIFREVNIFRERINTTDIAENLFYKKDK